MYDKILVIHPGALGDFVLSLPVIAGLREKYPRAHVEALARGGAASLADGIADKTGNLDTLAVAGAAGSSNYFNSLDLIITWSAGPGSPYVAEGFRGEAVILPAKPVSAVSASVFFFERISQLCGVEWRPARVRVTGAEASEAERLLSGIGLDPTREVLAVHPGSGGRKKCWPAAHFARVISATLNSGRQVLLLEGEADAEAVADVAGLLAGDHVALLRNLPLRMLAAVLNRCRLYLGNDSGVSHLAAAAGAECALIFGPTDPAVWCPAGPNVTAVVAGLPCSPCGEAARACQAQRCLTELTPERVLDVMRGREDAARSAQGGGNSASWEEFG